MKKKRSSQSEKRINQKTKKLNTKKRNTITTLISRLIFFLILAIVVMGGFIVSEVNLNSKLEKIAKEQSELQTTDTPNRKVKNETYGWATYENKYLGFTMKVPRDLILNDSGEHGDYYDFIRFEEGTTSPSKGVSVGISKSTAKEEVLKIKTDFQKSESAELAEEKNIMLNGYPATKLYFKPKNGNPDLEERMVLVVQNNKFTYSISTVPQQMNGIIEGFKFISINPKPTGTKL